MHPSIKAIRWTHNNGLGVNDTFKHRVLGECRVHRVNSDGSLTVVTGEVKHISGKDENVFRLTQSDNPATWPSRVENKS